MPPLFSICIPAYNHERYIHALLESVLRQDCADFEIIVSDDVSSDRTVEVVKSIPDRRLSLREGRLNLGPAGNWQRATELAQGEFLNILNSDDLMNPGALSTYQAVAEDVVRRGLGSREALLITSQMQDIDASGGALSTMHGSRGYYAQLANEAKALTATVTLGALEYEVYDPSRLLAYLVRHSQCAGAISTFVFSRALYESVGKINVVRRHGVDKAFAWKLLSQEPTYVHVVAPLYSYRIHPHQDSRAYQRVNARSVEDLVSLYDTPESVLKRAGLTREGLMSCTSQRYAKKVIKHIGSGDLTKAAELLAYATIADPSYSQTRHCRICHMLFLGGIVGRVLARLVGRFGKLGSWLEV